jgi:hypothetical protein
MWQAYQRAGEQSLPFLTSGNEVPPIPITTTLNPTRSSQSRTFILAVLAQIILVFFYLTHALQYGTSYPKGESYHFDLALLENILPSRAHRFGLAEDSRFAGPPSVFLDQAWSRLLAGINLRVGEEELSQHNQTSVALPQGGGYLAWLEVNHQLHCVVCVSMNILHLSSKGFGRFVFNANYRNG